MIGYAMMNRDYYWKKAKNLAYEYRIVFVICFALVAFVMLVDPVYAENKTLWEEAPTIGANLTTRLRELYCQAIFPPLAVITGISMALTKDDRTMATLKKALVTEVAVFFLIFLADMGIATAFDLLTGTEAHKDVDTWTLPSDGYSSTKSGG